MLLLASVAPPSSFHDVPPLVLYSTPMRWPPRPSTLPTPPTRPFDVMPTPAINVPRLASVGSKARLAIDSERCLSESGVQLAPPLCVTQMPPLVPPTYIVLASVGCGSTAWIAAPIVPLGGASLLWTVEAGPMLRPGPWLTKVCAIAQGAVARQRAAARSATADDAVKRRSMRGRAMAGST